MSNQSKDLNQKMAMITLDDLSGISAFEQWLIKNLNIYKNIQIGSLSFGELLILLDYIDEKSSDFKNKLDRKEWKIAILKLRTRLTRKQAQQ